MGFSLHAYAPLVIPCDDTRIVVEHRKEPIDFLLHVVRWLHDVRLED